jgi:hypothetical protein
LRERFLQAALVDRFAEELVEADHPMPELESKPKPKRKAKAARLRQPLRWASLETVSRA